MSTFKAIEQYHLQCKLAKVHAREILHSLKLPSNRGDSTNKQFLCWLLATASAAFFEWLNEARVHLRRHVGHWRNGQGESVGGYEWFALKRLVSVALPESVGAAEATARGAGSNARHAQGFNVLSAEIPIFGSGFEPLFRPSNSAELSALHDMAWRPKGSVLPQNMDTCVRLISRDDAVVIEDWHHTARFLFHFAVKHSEHAYWAKVEQIFGSTHRYEPAPLRSEALSCCFAVAKEKFKGATVLARLQAEFQLLAAPVAKGSKPPRGLLLWGPPGTGKTELTSVLCNRSGLVLAADPFPAPEINRPNVGEKELCLVSLMERGKIAPWLPMCVVIDEVESLAPNRLDEKRAKGGHEESALGVLLGVFQGVRDVPNMFMIACTNVMSSIDDAFLRRLTLKQFVGLPGTRARKEILQNPGEPTKAYSYLGGETSALLRTIVTLTTNFSGSNMSSLRNRLLARYNVFEEELSDEHARAAISGVAKSERIFLGPYLLTDVMNKQIFTSGEDQLQALRRTSFGLMYFDRRRTLAQLHSLWGTPDGSNVGEQLIPEEPMNFIDLEGVCAMIVRHVASRHPNAYIQLLSMIYFLNLRCNSESDMLLKARDLLVEAAQYESSWIIVDLDSVAQVLREETNPNFDIMEGMAPSAGEGKFGATSSVNYRVQHPHLWSFLTEAAQWERQNGVTFVFVAEHPYLITALRDALKWPEPGPSRSVKKLKCVRRSCRRSYVPAENAPDSCRYHPSKLMHEGSMVTATATALWNVLDRGTGSTAQMTLEEALEMRKKKDETPQWKQYSYMCCGAGLNSIGCQDAPHRSREPIGEDTDEFLDEVVSECVITVARDTMPAMRVQAEDLTTQGPTSRGRLFSGDGLGGYATSALSRGGRDGTASATSDHTQPLSGRTGQERMFSGDGLGRIAPLPAEGSSGSGPSTTRPEGAKKIFSGGRY